MTELCFFPFTHVTAGQKKILAAFFPKVRVLSLDLGPGDDQTLVPCRLSEGRGAALDGQVAEYLAWAQVHRGNEKNLRHLLKQTPYFKSDTDLTSIRSQITGSGRREEAGTAPDAGLFMKLAQTLDQDNDAIENRLAAIAQGKDALLAELKGDLGGDSPPLPGDGRGRPDPGEIMTDQRISAWAELAAEAGMLDPDTPVLVTTSPAVLARLKEVAGEVINGLDIDSIKVHENGCGSRDRWFQNFETLLDQITTGRLPEGGDTLGQDSGCCDLSGRIQVLVFPDGEINRIYKIPGRQVAVCLVGLNS